MVRKFGDVRARACRGSNAGCWRSAGGGAGIVWSGTDCVNWMQPVGTCPRAEQPCRLGNHTRRLHGDRGARRRHALCVGERWQRGLGHRRRPHRRRRGGRRVDVVHRRQRQPPGRRHHLGVRLDPQSLASPADLRGPAQCGNFRLQSFRLRRVGAPTAVDPRQPERHAIRADSHTTIPG